MRRQIVLRSLGRALPFVVCSVLGLQGGRLQAGPPSAAELEAECAAEIAAAAELQAQLLAVEGPRTLDNTLVPYNELSLHLDNMVNRAYLLSSAHPDEAVRAAGDACYARVAKIGNDSSLNPALYRALAAVPLDGLPPDARRCLELTLQEFRRAGVDQDDAGRARLAALREKETELAKQFEDNISQDRRSVKLPPQQLEGLSTDFVEAHPVGPDGLVEIPVNDVNAVAVLFNARSPEARRLLWTEHINRAWPTNEPVLKELLGVRHEIARQLGHANWADLAASSQMARSGVNIERFLQSIDELTRSRSEAFVQALLELKRKDDPRATALDPWDGLYYSRKLDPAQQDLKPEELRPYRDFRTNLQVLLDLTARLFGVEYRPSPATPRWHEDVEVYEVLLESRPLGLLYLDLHPRPGKFMGAANFAVRLGVEGRQLPETAILANWPRGGMESNDIASMFHELGHALNVLFAGRHSWVKLSGYARETDFGEVPALLLGVWATDPTVYSGLARHAGTGQPMPADLARRMAASRSPDRAFRARRGLTNSFLALRYHQADPATLDLQGIYDEVSLRYQAIPPAQKVHMYANFGHLGVYSALYYTYLWSDVITQDLLLEFRKHGMLDEATGRRFRDTILAPGGAKDADALVRDFLGRPFGFEAYQKWIASDR